MSTIEGEMMKNRLISAVAMAALLLVGGCSGFRKSVGVDKNAPDEFEVSRQAPLVVPPDFTLRPPRPGAPRPQEVDSQSQAIDTLFGPGSAQTLRSPGEQALLERAGAEKVASDIRSTVREDGTVVADKGVFLKELLASQSSVTPVDGVTIQQTSPPKKK